MRYYALLVFSARVSLTFKAQVVNHYPPDFTFKWSLYPAHQRVSMLIGCPLVDLLATNNRLLLFFVDVSNSLAFQLQLWNI
jgi:hypothetical protein